MPRLSAELLRRAPWGWRRGTVTALRPDGWLVVDCAEDGEVDAWHHSDLRPVLEEGAPVRVHARHGVLAPVPAAWPRGARLGLRSLHVASVLPPVPEPVALEVWADPAGAAVIDLRPRERVGRDS